MITSEQEKLPTNLRMGFCESCQKWYKFNSEVQSSNCPECGKQASNKVGFQITTQRSFDASSKKLTKTQLRKMGGIGV